MKIGFYSFIFWTFFITFSQAKSNNIYIEVKSGRLWTQGITLKKGDITTISRKNIIVAKNKITTIWMSNNMGISKQVQLKYNYPYRYSELINIFPNEDGHESIIVIAVLLSIFLLVYFFMKYLSFMSGTDIKILIPNQEEISAKIKLKNNANRIMKKKKFGINAVVFISTSPLLSPSPYAFTQLGVLVVAFR